jgi:phosphoglycolate phosphatase-like HAD superfamily hydrolase
MNEMVSLQAVVERRGIQHLVIDLDGTLVALDLDWSDWIDEVAALLPVRLRPTFSELLGNPDGRWAHLINECVRRDEVSLDGLYEAYARCEATLTSYRRNDGLITGVGELASRGCSVSVWTNNLRATALRVLDEIALGSAVTTVTARDDVRLGKPAVDGWMLIRRQNEERRALLVGDSESDREAAAAANLSFFQITYFT